MYLTGRNYIDYVYLKDTWPILQKLSLTATFGAFFFKITYPKQLKGIFMQGKYFDEPLQ